MEETPNNICQWNFTFSSQKIHLLDAESVKKKKKNDKYNHIQK